MAGYHNWFEYGRNDAEHSAGVLWVRSITKAIYICILMIATQTMEIFRQLGLDGEMEIESASDFDLDAGLLIVDKLIGGEVLAGMQEPDPARTAKLTPCKRLWLTQNMFEPLLRRGAHRFGAEQCFGTRVVHYEEQKDGVIVVC
ncbi:hypothetical protein Ao3042_01467 [Aspergillus oryzae 3.042]|uniref:FAD-binding domain-containing protein n=1 Tax=Aspergillus oryzae (strain 3.042) TaxID=1160506 RepID=I8A9Q2_ASPO3|nr:hypothetical protein Ao3042_01467 [Aspergillus oryzae 3.042]|eukprot:EIT81987.1 hypothetical protein Ao3042_01467 [Aspergillus oryzae 3.042]